MGVKVNYNNNKKAKPYKTIAIIVLVLFTLVILIKTIADVRKDLAAQKKANNQVQQTATTSTYSSIEELLVKYNAEFIRREDSKDLVKIYLSFNYDLFTGTTSNEFYFNNIAKALATFLDYKTFEMVDEERTITIRVYCEKPNITGMLINGDSNYYLNQETKNNKTKEEVEITRFTIQSPEFQALIDGNWDESKVEWGTRESTCDKYQIYFDEGIKYKVVARNVYNVVFTDKYQGKVAGGLTVNATKDAVISALGNPTLVSDDGLYGYLGEDSYLFFDFDNNEISIYPVAKIGEEDEKTLKEYIESFNKTSDVKDFATKLTGLWLDYDKYEYSSNYVDLCYTLKGVRLNISGNSLKNGIFIYQNYSGDRNILDMKNVYMESEDFVVEEERQRAEKENTLRIFEGDFEEESEELRPVGNQFIVRFSGDNTGPRFYSIYREYPDSELERTLKIFDYYWYNDYNFVYSVENEGTFVYNAVTREISRIEN